MGKRSRARCRAHVFAGTARESRPAQEDQAGRGLLRQWLSGKHRHEYPQAGRLPLCLQRSRKLAGVEEGEVSHRGRGRRRMKWFVPALLLTWPIIASAADFGVNATHYDGGAWSPYVVGAGIGVLS